MSRSTRHEVLAAGCAAVLTWLGAGAARAERRPPNGSDAAMLEARVREDIERRIVPLLEQMAPGQAELKYVDVRVTRPTALPAGAAPGFEEFAPGTEFVAEKAEVALTLDSKLPVPFRKDLKTLIKNRLDGIAVPIDIRETLIAFPTPRPQAPGPREMPFNYPPMPQMQQPPQFAEQRQPAPAPPPPVPQEPSGLRGTPIWIAIALAIAGLVIGALVMALLSARRRQGDASQAQERGKTADDGSGAGKAASTAAAAAVADHLPDVRRALREDRVLARRVMGELLHERELE